MPVLEPLHLKHLKHFNHKQLLFLILSVHSAAAGPSILFPGNLIPSNPALKARMDTAREQSAPIEKPTAPGKLSDLR